MTKILLTDDHAIIRQGLKILIEKIVPHCEIDEAWDGDSAFQKIKKNDYDLIILDVTMPDTDSFGLVGNIVAFKPKSKILMFSMNAEEIYAKKYLQLGAKGYVPKDSPEDEIKKAISMVLDNKKYLSAALSESLMDDALGGHKSSNPFETLSDREFEIATHLVRGETVSGISNKLNLHTSTVGTHKARIFEKLGCNNLVDLNTLAKVHHFVPE
jgi:two-component system, NarL family, invasion response regulator UvrY